MPFATRAIVGIAVLKLAWMLLALTLGRPALTAPRVGLAFGVLPTAVLTLAFGVTGGLLLWASAERSRAWWLGGTLLLIASLHGVPISLAETITCSVLGFGVAHAGVMHTSQNRHVRVMYMLWPVCPLVTAALSFGMAALVRFFGAH